MKKIISSFLVLVMSISVLATPIYAKTKTGHYYEYVRQGNETVIYDRQVGVANYDYQARTKYEQTGDAIIFYIFDLAVGQFVKSFKVTGFNDLRDIPSAIFDDRDEFVFYVDKGAVFEVLNTASGAHFVSRDPQTYELLSNKPTMTVSEGAKVDLMPGKEDVGSTVVDFHIIIGSPTTPQNVAPEAVAAAPKEYLGNSIAITNSDMNTTIKNIRIDGYNIIVTISDTEDDYNSFYADIMSAGILSADGTDHAKFKHDMSNSKQELDGNRQLVFTLDYMPNGTDNSLSITGSKITGNTLTPYYGIIMHHTLEFTIENGKANFRRALVYNHNKVIFDRNKMDKATLDKYIQSDNIIISDNPQVSSLAKEITKDSQTEYDKVAAVNNWVSENIYYDYPTFLGETSASQDVLTVLETKKAVCDGYATLTAALLRSVDIPAKYILGIIQYDGAKGWEAGNGTVGIQHAWNEAYVDGRWVILDTTWNSPNGYENGVFTKGDHRSNLYFDPTLEFFSMSHKIGEPIIHNNTPTLPDPKDTTVAHDQPAEVSTTSATSKVIIDGNQVTFQSYNIKDNNYFKLRDLAKALSSSKKKFEVSWDGSKNAIALQSGQSYTADGSELVISGKPGTYTAELTDSKIYLDGKEVQLTAYNIDGNNYFKLRDVGKAFNFGMTWDGQANMIVIDTNSGYKDE
ncbi:MAG: hypothetical protein K0R57_76 [Paenibacillaceae bacterium]|jgi:hypothetical protein|nr:hypothetical protein [Paenibacillaceae bacterium]